MSLSDYNQAKSIRAAGDPGFYAIIMAAMMKADTTNVAKLQLWWPDVWTELQARYMGPGGLLESEIVPANDPSLPCIFVWCNQCSAGWHSGVAIAEDGTGLAGHASTDHTWLLHDMGVQPNGFKRDVYAAHYPAGFNVVWVDDYHQELASNPRFRDALRLNSEKRAAEEAAKKTEVSDG